MKCKHCGAKITRKGINGFNIVHCEQCGAEYPAVNVRKLVLSLLCVVLAIALVSGTTVLALAGRWPAVEDSMEDPAFAEQLYAPPLEPSSVVQDAGSLVRFAANELIVEVSGGVDRARMESWAAGREAAVVGWDTYTGTYQLRFDTPFGDLTQAREKAEELVAAAGTPVVRAYPNYVFSLTVDAPDHPNDPKWDAWSDTPGGNNWGQEAIRGPEMWGLVNDSVTEDVNVGIFDNQFYTEHEDLQRQFAGTVYNAHMDPSMKGGTHGTHVAGIIGAVYKNGVGISGVGQHVHLYGAAFGHMNADGYDTSLAQIHLALTYLIEVNRSKVLNFSVGMGFAVYEKYVKECRDKGVEPMSAEDYRAAVADTQSRINEIFEPVRTQLLGFLEAGREFLIVKAAGNDNLRSDIDTGAALDFFSCFEEEELQNRILVVGNTQLAGDSYAISPTSTAGDRVDVLAPGTNVYSTVYDKCLFRTTSGYANMSGTSMAAPMAAGVAAEMWSVNPALTGAQVKQFIVETAAGAYGYADDTRYPSGRPEETHPLLDGFAAVQAALDARRGETAQIGSEGTAITLLLDTSGSMEGDPIARTREAAVNFVGTTMAAGSDVAVVEFNSYANTVADFTATEAQKQSAIQRMYAEGGTDMATGLEQCESLLRGRTDQRHIIVLMSDGVPEHGRTGDALYAVADGIKARGTTIYTLGFFSALGYGYKVQAQQVMERLASPGCHYEADDLSTLELFFGDMAEQASGQRTLYLRIDCPVDVRISLNGETLDSAAGQTRTSFGVLSFEENGEESAESDGPEVDRRTKVLRLKEEEGARYPLEIIGTADGTVDYTLGLMNEDGYYTDFRTFRDIPVQKGTRLTGSVENADTTYLAYDATGNSVSEGTYSVPAHGNMQPVSAPFPIIGVVVLAALLLLGLFAGREDLGLPLKKKKQ